ncbi:hypothetical protein B8W98_11165, partial [Lentilactobacillus parakefiri]
DLFIIRSLKSCLRNQLTSIMLLVFSAFDINTAKHFSVFILFEYLLVSSIAYWFQPKAGKIYKTK